MQSGVLQHSSWVITLQLFETFSRYDHVFSYEPAYIKDVLHAQLGEKGIWNPKEKVASRTAYLFSRFIKSVNK